MSFRHSTENMYVRPRAEGESSHSFFFTSSQIFCDAVQTGGAAPEGPFKDRKSPVEIKRWILLDWLRSGALFKLVFFQKPDKGVSQSIGTRLHPLMGNSACVSNKKEFPPISQRDLWGVTGHNVAIVCDGGPSSEKMVDEKDTERSVGKK